MTTSAPSRIDGLKRTTLDDYVVRMVKLQDYVAKNIDRESLSPDDLSKAAAMSKHHLHRVFRAMFGESIMEHLRRLRIERAAIELARTEKTILEVAVAAQYNSHEAFTRAFQKRFGLSPSKWRIERSEQFESAVPKAADGTVSVEIKRFDALRVLALRHCGNFSTIDSTFQKLVGWGFENGLQELPMMFGAYPDDPDITRAENLRSDACIATETIAPSGEVRELSFPAGVYAVTVHIGSYDKLHETYLELLGRWLPTSSFEPARDPVIESYLNDPATTPETDLRTEIRVRLQAI